MSTELPKITDLKDQQKLAKDMSDRANSPEGIKLLRSDLEKVKEVVTAIRNGFKQTGADLQVIDNAKRDQGKTVWYDRWDTYTKQFEVALASSKTLASRVSGYAQRFESVVCQVVISDATKQAKLDVLANHIELGQGFEKESKKMSEEFGALIEQLKKFKTDFGTWVKKLVGDVEKEIKDVDAEIARLKSSIKSFKLKIAGITAVGGAITSFAALGLFPAFAPFVAIAAIIAVAASAIMIHKINGDLSEAEGDLVKQEAKKVELAKKLDDLKLLQQEYETKISNKIDGIIEGLGLFEGIWKAVADDCNQIVTWLEQAAGDIEKSRDSAPPTFHAYLENSSTYYKALADGLDMYTKGT